MLAALVSVAGIRLYGQSAATGTIIGNVTDPQAAAVPAAVVSVLNEGTGVERSMPTNGAGLYMFTSLPVGTYRIRVSKPGFSAVEIPNLVLDVGARLAVDINLKVGAVSETVAVQAEAPLLQTETNTVQQVVNNQVVVEIPLNGRDFQQLQLLTPGVVPGSNVTGPTSSSIANYVNGMRPNATAYLMDGGDNTQQAFRGTEFVPPIDAIQEFDQVSSNATAEYGLGPTTVNVAIKSGTNQLHGALWEFVRNKVFDARSFFAPARDDLKRNQFGAAVGGPVIRNKIFFFASYEGNRLTQTSPTFASVPLVPYRTGDFSSAPNQIFDPLTSRTLDNGQILRDPFPGKIIPSSRINPASTFMASLIPLPNAPGTSNNYRSTPASQRSPNTLITKFDAQPSSKDRLFFTGGLYYAVPTSPGPYAPSNIGVTENRIPAKTGVLGWTRSITPATLLNVKFSDSWAQGILDSPTVDPNRGAKDLISQLGIDPVNGGLPFHGTTPGYPSVSIFGLTGINGVSHFPTGWRMNQMLWSANMSTLRGKHSLQYGYALRYWKGGFFAQGDHRGNWTVDGRFTVQPGVGQTQANGWADFLLGYPWNSNRTAPWSWFYYSFKSHWAYAQDSYRVSSKFTLNFGIRYEVNPWPVERRHQFANWVPWARNGRGAIIIPATQYVQGEYLGLHPPTAAWMNVFNRKGTVLTADQVGLPQSLRRTDTNNFAPRVGFAWSAAKRTVLRGGYGIYYIPADLNHNLPDTGTGPPFLDRTTPLYNTYPIPAYNFQNSYCRSSLAAFPGQCVAGDPFAFPDYPGLPSGDPNERNGYVQQWDLTIQHTFGSNWLLEAAYIGNKGNKLEGAYPVNNPLPAVGDIQPRRPYPDFGTVTTNMSRANSNYNSMQWKVTHQFGSGLALLASYTWSKSIDDLSDAYNQPLNPYNLKINKAVSTFDIPHRVAVGYVYDLPLPRHTGAIRYLANGWRVTGILSAQSGFPFTPGWSGDPTNTGSGTVPDRVCNGSLSNPTPSRWFDTSCFVSPSILPGSGGLVTNYGNSGRNILRADGKFNIDLGMFKQFNFTERFRSDLRFEAFNLTNHANFNNPATNVNVPGAGVVNSVDPPRQIQLGLKVYF